MEKAIKKALQGGYREKGTTFEFLRMFPTCLEFWLDNKSTGIYSPFQILLDPLFWQALGKAEGWQKEPYLCPDCRVIGTGKGNHMNECKIKDRKHDWQTYWHSFIDHLANNGSIDEFFNNLLK